MFCCLPVFSKNMFGPGNVADANALICRASDISKGSATAGNTDGARSGDVKPADEPPPCPITPSPRQTSGAWQRPSQSGTDSGQASTSDSNEQRTRLRWAINIKRWTPWDDEWLFLLDMLPKEDQKEVSHEVG